MTYMPQLDGLRALSVAAVAFHHWGGEHFRIFGFTWGGLGVGFFFVLSGFLITTILLRIRSFNGNDPRGIGLRRFWIRRVLRIFPVFYITILLGIVLGVPGIADNWKWHALYGSNFLYAMNAEMGYSTHFWTLAVEEQFYLFWPCVILFAPTKAIPRVIIIFIISAVLWRFFAASGLVPTGPFKNVSPLLPSQLDFLCFGALLSWVVTNPKKLNPAIFSKTVGLIGVIGVVGLSSIEGVVPLKTVCLVMIFTSIVYWASQGVGGPIGKLLRLGPIVYLGRMSYGIYIFHNLVLFFWYWIYYSAPIPGYRILFHLGIAEQGASHIVLKVTFLIVTTVALASMSWYLVEAPINRLKRFFPYSLSSA